MNPTRDETIAALQASREWIAKAAEQVRPLGAGASGQHDAMLARIDRALAAEGYGTPSGHPMPASPRVRL